MGKKKQNSAAQSRSSNKSKQKTKTSPEEQRLQKQIDAFDFGSSPYTHTLNKRIRNVNKKLAKIATLEEKPLGELNEDQKQSIARKPELLADLEQFQSIQKDLVKVHLQATSADSQSIQVQQKEESVESFEGGLSRLCKLNVVSRLPCFDKEEDAARVLAILELNPNLTGITLSKELLREIKSFSNLLSGYLTKDVTVTEAVQSSSSLAMKYISQSTDTAPPHTTLSFRSIGVIIDAIADAWNQ